MPGHEDLSERGLHRLRAISAAGHPSIDRHVAPAHDPLALLGHDVFATMRFAGGALPRGREARMSCPTRVATTVGHLETELEPHPLEEAVGDLQHHPGTISGVGVRTRRGAMA